MHRLKEWMILQCANPVSFVALFAYYSVEDAIVEQALHDSQQEYEENVLGATSPVSSLSQSPPSSSSSPVSTPLSTYTPSQESLSQLENELFEFDVEYVDPRVANQQRWILNTIESKKKGNALGEVKSKTVTPPKKPQPSVPKIVKQNTSTTNTSGPWKQSSVLAYFTKK